MKKESIFKLFIDWAEDFWEEIEIQFYGIAGAIFFFMLVYFLFHPLWMQPLIDFVYEIKTYIFKLQIKSF